MRSSLRSSTTKLLAVGLDQLDEAPDVAPLWEGLNVTLMASPVWRLFRFQPRLTKTGGELASRSQCFTLPLSSLASKPIST